MAESNFWNNLLGGAVGAYGAYDIYDRVTDLGEEGYQDMRALGDEAQANTQFTPYTVTGNVGSGTIGPGGSTSYALSGTAGDTANSLLGAAGGTQQLQGQIDPYIAALMDQQRAARTNPGGYSGVGDLKNNYFSGANQALAGLAQPTAQREMDLYNRQLAMMAPDEERRRMEMEQNLLAQGRLGVQTGAYGGTPEQLAMEKAIAESRNSAWNNAFGQAQAERAQLQNQALGLGQAGYQGASTQQGLASQNVQDIINMANSRYSGGSQAAQSALQYTQAGLAPEAMMIDALNAGMQNSNLSQTGQIAGANLLSQLGLGGLQTRVNQEKIANEMLAGMWNNLAGITSSGLGNDIASGVGSIWDWAFGGGS
jgi:hypothetical protein